MHYLAIMSEKITVLGCMSGSSLDGLDMAICEFEGTTIETIKWNCLLADTMAFPAPLQEKLAKATNLSAKEYLELEVEFSEFCAAAITQIVQDENVSVDYIASHGHTIFHFPTLNFTAQIGSAATIAELTGIPTINDFRTNDIAKGGQGAPLAPIAEQWIYSGNDLYINLGGIANISYHNGKLITSFDSCPCNQVLNAIARERDLEYDSGGNLARQGTVIEEMLDQSLHTDYMALPAPKSLDNTWVMQEFAPPYMDQSLSVEDRLATMTEFIAIQLSLDIKRMTAARPSDKLTVLITGGGTHNDLLLDSLEIHTGDLITIVKPDELTINFKEAILMSFMGYLRMQNIPNTLPTVTGAEVPTIGGSLSISFSS